MNWFSVLQAQRLIAVIRSPTLAIGWQLAQTVAEAGITSIEITWNSDRPAQLITQLRQALPHCWIGAGTLLTPDHTQRAIAAGAQFLFSPHTQPALIQLAVQQQVPIVPGALTPTEIVTAWQAGATAVKVFPIQAVGGAAYIRQLQAPLGHIPLIPTGGVTLENARSFLEAGAIAVGLSGQLFPPEWVQAENWQAIGDRVRQLVEQVHKKTLPDPQIRQGTGTSLTIQSQGMS